MQSQNTANLKTKTFVHQSNLSNSDFGTIDTNNVGATQ